MAQTATSTVQVDNETTCITHWHFEPGQETGWHYHGCDYIVVPVKSGRLRLVSSEGETFADTVAGQSYFRQAGVEHNVINDDMRAVEFVEIEIKSL